MIQIKNIFSEEKINPRMWDREITKFNIWYMIKEFFVIFIGLSLVLSALNLFEFINFGFTFVIFALIVAILRVVQQMTKFMDFLEVPVGHLGIVTILDEVQGSFTDGNKYHLEPGKYRNIVNIFFYGDILNIITPPRKYNNFDYEFKNVLTKDGIKISGTYTGRPQLVDPWAWTTLLMATQDYDIHRKKIEDISLEAMNNAADNLTAKQMLKAVGNKMQNASDFFKEEYKKELGNLVLLTPAKEPIVEDVNWNREIGDAFFFPETGLNIIFNIKTRIGDDKTMESLAAEVRAEEEAKGIEIRAEAEKLRLTIEGKGKAEAKKAIETATQQVFVKSYNDNIKLLSENGVIPLTNEMKDKAIHYAALTANQYKKEILSVISGPNGEAIEGGFSLEKLIALGRTLFEK